MNRLLICVHGVGTGAMGWLRILEQERLPYVEDAGQEATVTLFADTVPAWMEDYVMRGGVAVVSGAPLTPGLLPSGQPAVISRFRSPGNDSTAASPCLAVLFSGGGFGEVRLHEDRRVKRGVDPDVYPLVLETALGRGRIIFTGVPLTDLLAAGGDRLRRFSAVSELSERVATADKAEIADVLVWMLRRAVVAAGFPYLRVVRYPGGAPSVFILRVDVDGIYGENARSIAEAAASQGIRASFFFNGSLCEEVPGDLGSWTEGHEVGHHGYYHTVYDTVEDNVRNLERGAEWVRSHLGRDPRGFVAPRGLWNQALEEALVKQDDPYSSDFALDFDSLPFHTPGGVLQIPVHPFSPERAAVFRAEMGLPPPTAEDITAHYLYAVRNQVRHGRPAHLYGHPEVLGATASEVVPAIVREIRHLGARPLTVGEFYSWWTERHSTGLAVAYDPDREVLEITTSGRVEGIEAFDHPSLEVRINRRHLKASGARRSLLFAQQGGTL